MRLPIPRRGNKSERLSHEGRHTPGTRLDPHSAEAARRVAAAREMLASCSVCPRLCGAARLEGEMGTCRAADVVRVASWNLHHGEEPPISGHRGSGTIFFSGCPLRCMYCQNYPISQRITGRSLTPEDLAAVMLQLSGEGAHNINLVTPTHFTPQILEAVLAARRRGLDIPVVWNTAGYERVETLRLLDGIVDIYLADMRYGKDGMARRYSRVKSYTGVNRAAIAEMHRQVGDLTLDEKGIARRGLLVRHLVLPGGSAGSERVFAFLAREVSPLTAVSVMSQYFPAYRAVDDPLLGRKLVATEYDAALAAFTGAGLSRGFHQDLDEEMSP